MLGELEAASPHLKIKDADPDFHLASSVIFFNSRSPSHVNIYLSQTIIIRVFNFQRYFFFKTVIFRRKKIPRHFYNTNLNCLSILVVITPWFKNIIIFNLDLVRY